MSYKIVNGSTTHPSGVVALGYYRHQVTELDTRIGEWRSSHRAIYISVDPYMQLISH